MGDIVIVGAGFAGLKAARILSRNRAILGGRRVLVVDKKKTFDFLPILPDVIGGRIKDTSVTLDLASYLERYRINFENSQVVRIDTESREIYLDNGNVLAYEFLVIAAGSVTNFHNFDEASSRALKLDSILDAQAIRNAVLTYPSKKMLVAGGGYTGVEIASNLALLFQTKGIEKYSISIIESGEDILGALPEWIRSYCRLNLSDLRINVHVSASIKDIGDKRVKLTNGMEFDNYILIWAAGVKATPFIHDLSCKKDGQGRLVVDECMSFGEKCFAIGDTASFKHNGRALRMAVQFSIAEAQVAAKNIMHLIKGSGRLVKYRPLDFGFLVPLANRKAVGQVFGIKVKGFFGWLLHYFMCIYRSLSLKNRVGIFCNAFLKG